MTELEEVTQIIEQEIILHRGRSYDFSLKYAAAKIADYYNQKSRDTQETSTNVSVKEYYTLQCNWTDWYVDETGQKNKVTTNLAARLFKSMDEVKAYCQQMPGNYKIEKIIIAE